MLEKRIINGPDIQELFPLKYKWAWEKYNAECSNHWLAQEINMQRDIEQYKSGKLTPDEVHLVKRNLGFFVTADSLAANNIVLGLMRHMTAPEIRQYHKRQAYTEAVHTEAYQHIVESLGLDEGEIFNAYKEVDVIRNKDEFLMSHIEVLTDSKFSTGDTISDQKLLRSIIVFAGIMEGLDFYPEFGLIFSLGRRNLLPGTSEQYQYIMRDESMHCNFGIDLANSIKLENPHLWTPQFKDEIVSLFRQAVELESLCIKDALPRGILGMNSAVFIEYMKFICNRRLNQLGLDEIFPGATNTMPWMSEMIDLKKEKNFFETRVTEYQSNVALSWE